MFRWFSPLACMLIGTLFFFDTIILDRTVIPTGALYTEQPWKSENAELAGDAAQQYDLIQQFYPWAHYFKKTIRERSLPLWNPYNYLGTPFFANPQTALLFPLTWLHLLFPLRYSFSLILIAKLTLSLLGMYFWLRSLRLEPVASLLGAVIFGLSMNTVSSLVFPYSNVTIVFPWALLFLKRFLERPERRDFVCLVLSLVLIVFAGQPQSALPAFLALFLYSVLPGSSRRLTNSKKLGLISSAFFLAGLVTAIQWIPSLEYVSESMVPFGPRIVKSTYPFSLNTLITLIVPDFFGSLLRGDYWGFPGYHYTAFYSSVLALLLLPFAFKQDGRRGPGVLFPILTITLALGVILGLPPFEQLLNIPGFDLLRRHRFSFLVIFSLAELAARGADSIFRGEWLKVRKLRVVLVTALFLLIAISVGFWTFRDFLEQLDPLASTFQAVLKTVCLVAVGGAVITLLRGRLASLTLAALVLLDLGPISFSLNPRGTPSSLYPPSELAQNLVERDDRPRIFSFHPIFNPNTALVYGLQDVRGYDVMTPRRLFRYMQKIDPDLGNLFPWLRGLKAEGIHRWTLMLEAVEEGLASHGEELRNYLASDSYWTVGIRKVENRALFDLLQIEYLLGPPAERLSELSPLSLNGDIGVYFNPMARHAGVFFDWKETQELRALEMMSDVDLERTVVVEALLPPPDPHPQESQTSVKTLALDRSRSHYLVELERPAVLVEFARFSPGWKAVLDHEKTIEVFPADLIFRAVFLPAGKHELVLSYRPDSFRYGLLLSITGVILLLFSIVVIFRVRTTDKGRGIISTG